jgi:hypothetical protein
VVQDPLVGYAKACAELVFGWDWRPYDRWHVGVEIGPGSTLGAGAGWFGAPQTAGAGSGAGAQGSGGFHGAARLLLGVDPAPLLFVRVGGEVLLSAPLRDAAASLHLLADLGTRTGATCMGSPLELGVRAFAGADQTVSIDALNAASRLWTTGYGAQLLARYVFR